MIYVTKRTVNYKTIGRWLKKRNRRGKWFDAWEAAFEASVDMEIPLDVTKEWLASKNSDFRVVALKGCTGKNIPLEFIEQGLRDKDCDVRIAALEACKGKKDVPLEIIKQGLYGDIFWEAEAKVAALNACVGRKDVPLEIIQDGIDSRYSAVRIAALNVCVGRKDIPLEIIRNEIGSFYPPVRAAVLNACVGREDVPLDFIGEGLYDDIFWEVKVAALNACVGRKDVPLSFIERGLLDINDCVKSAAMNVYEKNFPNLFKYFQKRTFEPPARVFQRCHGDVIVVAEIPQDAFVRGNLETRCRSNKAMIIDIYGKCDGEKVGVPGNDEVVFYLVGDKVETDSFDPGFNEYGSGFHFYCLL